METNVVSHSMAEGFAKCRKQFEIQHVLGLMPKTMPSGLRKGNSGHAFFDGFLTEYKLTKDTAKAKAAGLNKLMAYKHVAMELVPMLISWVEKEWPKYERRWEILEIEKTYHLVIEIGDKKLYFPFTVDLLVRDLVTGKILLIDHKCLYDPYGEKEMEMLPQQPKYMGALRALGIPVDEAYYNIVRSRKMKETGYESMMVRIPISNERIKSAMRDQIAIMREIGNDPVYYRTANSLTCKSCTVFELCKAQQNNEDTEAITDLHFEQNEYGYTVKELEDGTAGRNL